MREHELLDTLIFWVFCKRAYLNLKKIPTTRINYLKTLRMIKYCFMISYTYSWNSAKFLLLYPNRPATEQCCCHQASHAPYS